MNPGWLKRTLQSGKDSQVPLRAVAFLAAVLMCVYGRLLFGGQTFAGRDHLRIAVPARAQLIDALRSGHVPEWWDGIGLGISVASQPYYESAYPPAWLAVLFGPGLGTDVVLVLHLLIGGVGLFAWARRLGASEVGALVGAALFMLGGYSSSTLVLHTLGISPMWFPWVAWGADRLASAPIRLRSQIGAVAVAAIPTSMLILSGDPSAMISGALVGLVVAAARSKKPLVSLSAMAATIVMAALMSAVVLLPTALHVSDTDRSGGMDTSLAVVWSLHPLTLLQIVWPSALGVPTDPAANLAKIFADTSGNNPGMLPAFAYTLYVGWLALWFTFAGATSRERGARILAVASLVMLLVAMGSFTPVYAVFRAIVLPERLLRHPAKHFPEVLVLWAGLSSIGFDRIVADSATGASRRFLTFSLGIVATITLFVAMAGENLIGPAVAAKQPMSGMPVDTARAVGAFVNGGITTFAALLAFGAALLLASRPKWSRFGVYAAAAVFVAEIGLEAARLLPLAPRDEVMRLPKMLEGLASNRPEGGPRPRIMRLPFRTAASETDPTRKAVLFNDTVVENVATMYGFAQAPGYDPILPRHLLLTLKAADRAGDKQHLLDLFDIRHVILRQTDNADPPEGMQLSARYAEENAVMWSTARPRPRAFVTSKWAFSGDDEQTLEAMFQLPHDLDLIRLEGNAPTETVGAKAAAVTPCEVRSTRPERVELLCPPSSGGYAVLLDAWAEGWSATVDDKPAEVERADMMVRAVRVGAGEHKIMFSYRAPGFRIGALLTIVAWVVAWLLTRLSEKPEQRSDPADVESPGEGIVR
jgi:hypothetical protein